MDLNKQVLSEDYWIEKPEVVTEDRVVDYLATLSRLAELGGATSEELTVIERVAARVGVGEDVMRKALERAKSDVKTADMVGRFKARITRLFLLRDCYRTCLADGDIQDEEEKALRAIAGELDVSPEDARRVRQITIAAEETSRSWMELAGGIEGRTDMEAPIPPERA